jgi:hypothetical protein
VRSLGGWSFGDPPLLTLADVAHTRVVREAAHYSMAAAAELEQPPARSELAICPCRRILLDSEHLGAPEHEHDWLDDGEFCCLDVASYKRQLCWCRARRWVVRDEH